MYTARLSPAVILKTLAGINTCASGEVGFLFRPILSNPRLKCNHRQATGPVDINKARRPYAYEM